MNLKYELKKLKEKIVIGITWHLHTGDIGPTGYTGYGPTGYTGPTGVLAGLI
jgi:hypothetical protein